MTTRRTLLILFAAAFVVQMLPLLVLPGLGSRDLFGDEIAYAQLAAQGQFDTFRPPGYPLFVRVVGRSLTEGYLAVYVVQSLVMAFRPVLVFLLLRHAGVNRVWAFSASAASALSFTALALPKRLLADALLGVLTPVAVLAAALSVSRGRTWAWLGSVATAAGLLLKPVMMVWFVIAPLLLTVKGARRGRLAVLSAVLLLLPGAVCSGVWLANYVRDGIGTYSVIGRVTVLRYWVPATLCLADTGVWDAEKIEGLRAAWTRRGALEPRPPEHLMREAWGVLTSHPLRASQALVLSAWRNLPRPFFPNELGVLVADSLIPPLVWVLGKGATYALWLLSMLGLCVMLNDGSTRNIALVVTLFATVFVVVTSVSHNEGARLLFPIEWCLFFFAGGLLHYHQSMAHQHQRRSADEMTTYA